jgi:hypothetical protein
MIGYMGKKMDDKYCTTCGAKIPPNSEFCMTCGAAVPTPPPGSREFPPSPTDGYSSQGNTSKAVSSLISGFAFIIILAGIFIEGFPFNLALFVAFVLWFLSAIVRRV